MRLSGHKQADRVFCGTASAVNPTAPGEAGAAEATGGGTSRPGWDGAEGAGGAGPAVYPGAGVVLRAQGVGGLGLYYYPLPEVPVRWGGCSSKGNLSLNCLLMLAPPEVIDSVVVHELYRRREVNHSADFYAHVLRVFPEYRTWRRWLKENGPTLLLRRKEKKLKKI